MTTNSQSYFITGGASGIGEATVRALHEQGHKVTFTDIDTSAGTQLADSLGSNTLFIAADTRDKKAMECAVARSVETFGNLNGVFANAGIHRKNTILTIPDSELDDLIDINIRGTINTLQATLPHLIDNGGGAVVINASDQSLIGKRTSFGYGLTKGALGQMTRSLALDMAQYHIRVNAVCPGTIYTPLVEKLFQRIASEGGPSADELVVSENAEHPIGRMGRADEVAAVVTFLLSNQASFMTGALVPVDGALTAQ